MFPSKLDRKLRLAYPAKAMQDKDLPSVGLPLGQEGSFKLCHLCWSVYELIYQRNTFEAK
jgi:hypothetical protein